MFRSEVLLQNIVILICKFRSTSACLCVGYTRRCTSVYIKMRYIDNQVPHQRYNRGTQTFLPVKYAAEANIPADPSAEFFIA